MYKNYKFEEKLKRISEINRNEENEYGELNSQVCMFLPAVTCWMNIAESKKRSRGIAFFDMVAGLELIRYNSIWIGPFI